MKHAKPLTLHSRHVYLVTFERLGTNLQHRIKVCALSGFEAHYLALKHASRATGYTEASFVYAAVQSLGLDKSFLKGETVQHSKVLETKLFDTTIAEALQA